MKNSELRLYLDRLVDKYNHPDFIKPDPIAIPHAFSKLQDIEIAGLLAAVFAWGQRKTILNKSREFLLLMDNSPHDFVLNYTDQDLKPFLEFKHRTFNSTDALYFLHFLKWYYENHDSLEEAFVASNSTEPIEQGLINFSKLFFSLPDHPHRTYKHIPNPLRKSACKRLNMFLRWMVRKDDRGVDFGIWKNISPSVLICPCDVHVDRIARRFGLLQRKQTDWQAALELTNELRKLDPLDPVKYDFALFGVGVEEKAISSN